MIDHDEPPDDRGHVTSLTGNGLGLLDGRQLQASPPPSVLQGSSHLAVHKDVDYYVSTPALEEAYGILQDRGWVVLCGPLGSGKTTLAHALCRRSSTQDQYTEYVLPKVHLWTTCVGEKKQSVVLLDGNFGKCSLDEEQYKDWQLVFNTILEMLKKGWTRLVITVYPHILHELQQRDSHLDSFLKDDFGIVWLTDPLPEEVRKDMLKFHLKKLQETKKLLLESVTQRQIVETVLLNDESGPVFPWCCYQMVKQWSTSKDHTSVFLVPAEAHALLLKDMVLDKDDGAIFVALLVLRMKGISNFLHNLWKAKGILRKLDMRKVDADTLTRYENILHGRKSILFQGKFSSQVLYEAAGLALGRNFRLPTLLRVCDVPFLVKYMHFTLKDQAVPCVTVGGVAGCSNDSESCTADQQALVERICKEILEGNLQTICQHPSLQCPVFLKALDDYCAKNKTRMEQLLNAKDTVHRLPLVYWSAFLPSPILTQWCLDKVQGDNQLSVVSLVACSLFDLVTQTSPSRLHSLLSERLNANVFKNPDYIMEFPFPDQCLTKEVQQLMRTLRCAELVQGRLPYLLDPSMPLTPDLVTVLVSQDRLRLQVKDTCLWYLVFRLLTDREVREADSNGDSLLHIAVNSGEREVVRLSLNAGAVITQKNGEGVTPHQLTEPKRRQAAKQRTRRNTDCIFSHIVRADKAKLQFCLLYDINVNQKNRKGETALMLMCNRGWSNDAEIISLLLQLGSDVRMLTKKSVTPLTSLLWDAIESDPETVRVFLQHGADVSVCDANSNTPLLLAAKNGRSETVQVLLQHGADISVQNKDHDTPLLLAIRNGYSGTVKILLEHATDICLQDRIRDTSLLVAAQKGYSEAVQELLKQGADVNALDEHQVTALLMAAKNGHHETVRVLLQNGANVNAQDNLEGDTPLLLAARFCIHETVQALCENGADVSTQNRHGVTPLLAAATVGDFDKVKTLLQYDADVRKQSEEGQTPLLAAAKYGHSRKTQELLQHHAEINVQDDHGDTPLLKAVTSSSDFGMVQLLLRHSADVNQPNKHGVTPLLLATRHGQCNIVQELLLWGADGNAQCKCGNTPLLMAAKNGQFKTVMLLLQLLKGVDVNVKDNAGSTPLLMAARTGHFKTVKVLLDKGADIDVKNNAGNTPLLMAASSGHFKTVKVLLEKGADVNVKNNAGNTPLLMATSNGHFETIKVLLEKGADVNVKNNAGNTPLLMAASNGHFETIKVLLREGVNVNAHNVRGETPLMLAANRGDSGTVHALLQHGANINVQDAFGRTALQLACRNGHSHETVHALVQNGATADIYVVHFFSVHVRVPVQPVRQASKQKRRRVCRQRKQAGNQ